MADTIGEDIRSGARAAWAKYLDAVEPFRPDLARYCRRLTGHVWDAEDLAQDTLLRAFGLLGSVFHPLANPRAYLLRIATNIWIDAQRRRVLEAAIVGDVALSNGAAAAADQEDRAQVRDAGVVLLQFLAPQERAAVLLKDVLDMSLDETAAVLGTTPGAVKAALHRGRGRLKDGERQVLRPAPDPRVVDQFADRYNARDIEGLIALMLESASVEMTVVNNEFGREGFVQDKTGWFFHTVIGFPGEHEPPPVRWVMAEFRGEPLIVQLHTLWGDDAATSVIRLETEKSKVARVRCYTFCPDAVREVAAELGLSAGPLFYSFPPFMAAWRSLPAAALG